MMAEGASTEQGEVGKRGQQEARGARTAGIGQKVVLTRKGGWLEIEPPSRKVDAS